MGLSKSSTHRILKKDLNLSAFKFKVSQKLSSADFEQREEFCKWFLQQCTNSPSFLSCVWWSDEAHFHLNGQVNRQNYRFWAERPPEEVLEAPLHSPKVTVWCALSAQGIIDPIFFFKWCLRNGQCQFPALPCGAQTLLACPHSEVCGHAKPAVAATRWCNGAYTSRQPDLAARASGEASHLPAGRGGLAAALS